MISVGERSKSKFQLLKELETLKKRVAEFEKVEEALKMLDNAVKQAVEMVVITDGDGAIEYVNPAVEKITGYTEEEIIGQNPRVLKSDRHDKKFYEKMWKTITAGKMWHGQLVNKKKSGELYDEEMTISPVQNTMGKITHFIAIKRDISEAKSLRQQLIQAEKLSSVGTFVSGVAHELNNPLSVVSGFSESLSNSKNLSPDIARKIKIIAEESRRAAVIVQNLLRFSRKTGPIKRPLRINDVLAGVLNLQSYNFRSENIKIRTDYRKDLPIIKGDVNQLQQVFMNIILNACHEVTEAHGKGILTVKTEKRKKEIIITFENDGPPIPEDNLNKIFDPFFTTKQVGKGTGLGLSISYGIIEEHGGKIWAENIKASGVRFVITFPIAITEVKASQPGIKKRSTTMDIRILLVYDDEKFCHSLSSFLARKGISAITANSGSQAVKFLQQNEFDVIFSDVKKRQINGLEIGKWLKKNKPERLNMFILLTGIIDRKIERYCAQYHCSYLIKPATEDRILETIGKIMTKTS